MNLGLLSLQVEHSVHQLKNVDLVGSSSRCCCKRTPSNDLCWHCNCHRSKWHFKSVSHLLWGPPYIQKGSLGHTCQIEPSAGWHFYQLHGIQADEVIPVMNMGIWVIEQQQDLYIRCAVVLSTFTTTFLSSSLPSMAEDQRELQLLPTSSSSWLSCHTSNSSSNNCPTTADAFESPSLDLQLSMSFQQVQPAPDCEVLDRLETHRAYEDMKTDGNCIKALKQHAAEQIRLAAIDKAHVDRMRELTRWEMELAESEFTRAKHMWNRAREEVQQAERMKEKATRRVDSLCMEITCQSCRQRFRP